jgi:hypothetical protein
LTEERAMSGRAPHWDCNAASASVLMEYLKRASPQFVAAELDELGLLNAADEAAALVFDDVAARRASDRVYEHVLRTHKIACRDDVPAHAGRHARASVWVVALAMCAMLGVLAETLHVGAINVLPEDGGKFMQLAGPTSEW